MMWQGEGWNNSHWLMVAIVMLLAWALVIAAVICVWRALAARPSPASAGSSVTDARRLVDERFARGEIDAAEYQARRDTLSPR